MFNLSIGSKLRGRDLVSLRVRDVTHVNQVVGPQDPGARARGGAVACEVHSAVRPDDQYRRSRCSGDLDGDPVTGDANRSSEDGRPAGVAFIWALRSSSGRVETPLWHIDADRFWRASAYL